MTSDQKLQAALADPSCHDSLKTAIRAFAGKDVMGALNDLEWLVDIFEGKLRENGLGPIRSV